MRKSKAKESLKVRVSGSSTSVVSGSDRASPQSAGPQALGVFEAFIMKYERSITNHKIGTYEEWLAARLDLLEAEKELTRRSDELAQRRQELPWVRIDKEYRFETDEGSASLADLFRGRSQLLVYHFVFGYGSRLTDERRGCTRCSLIADHFDGVIPHLNGHDITLVCESIAPLQELQDYKRQTG
jgi:predicted dithiol-disulfide oxidoreductase (DUF899 family)